MTKQVEQNDNLLFVISTVNSANGEVLYYVANNQPNSAFVTGNTGVLTVNGNVSSVNLTITSNAVFASDFTLQIRRNSIVGPVLRESANVYVVPPPLPLTHGWFGGGRTSAAPSFRSVVDRITFASDTTATAARGPMSSARYLIAATGNSDFGWIGGASNGSSPGGLSTVDRIDFAADTATASARGPLSLGRRALSATGNDDYGWFATGGNPSPVTRVDRIDFAADTATASVRGTLGLGRNQTAATGTDDYGWITGGSPANSSRVDRIDFADDTAAASVRGPLSSGRYQHAATGNDDYGWFGAGKVPATVSSVTRIDFADDTATAVARGPISSARYTLAATGNSDFGWWGGGGTSSGQQSTVDRIDFAADTATASARGPLSLGRHSLAATSGNA